MKQLEGRPIKPGVCEGEALVSDKPIGFLGGVDPETGIVIEPGHPLEGHSVAGKILVFPTGKGSTVGSYTIYRLARAGVAPAGIICAEGDPIVVVGAIISEIPMVDRVDISRIKTGDWVRIEGDKITIEPGEPGGADPYTAAWLWHILTGLVLMAAGELLLWDFPPDRTPIEWAFIVIGYIALGAALNGLIIRYRVHTVYGLLPAVGAFGVAAGTLVTGGIFDDWPGGLLFKALGWYSLVGGIGALTVLWALVGGKTSSLAPEPASAILGLSWGIWAYGKTSLVGGADPPEVWQVALIGAIIVMIIGGAVLISHWKALNRLREKHLAPGLPEWTLIAVVLAVTFTRSSIPPCKLPGPAALIAFLILVLFARRVPGERSLLSFLPPDPISPVRYGLIAALFLAGGVGGRLLAEFSPPLAEGLAQVIASALLALGLLWPLAISVIAAVTTLRK